MIQVNVAMMAVDTQGSPVVILRPVDTAVLPGLVLPIWIGPAETVAILIAGRLEDAPDRPLTYDLLASLLQACEATVEQVEVTKLEAGTFYAEVTLATPGGVRVVDARPSDSIALALRVGAPIFVAEEVFGAAGIPDPSAGAGDVDADPGQTMAEFSEFLEHVDPDDFRN